MNIRLLLAAALAALLLPGTARADYRGVVLATHPEAYWGLGEALGSTAYDFVNGHNGYYRQPGPGVSWLRGAQGLPAADAYDGGFWVHGNADVRGGDYGGGTVEISQRTGWATFYGRQPFSANIWLNWNGYYRYITSDLTQGVIGNENSNYYLGGWSITIPGGTGESGPAKLAFRHSFSSTGFITSSVTLPVGAWTMVTATYDGLTMRFYQDGRLVGQLDDANLLYGGYADTFWVGAQDFNRFLSGYWGSFNGTLDELTYWRRALTAQEIAQIFTAGAPAPPPPPPDRRRILYFVPGIAGSELRQRHDTVGDLSIWPDAVVWSGAHDFNPLPGFDPIEGLRVADDGTTSVHDVYPSKVQDSAFGSDIYGTALSEFRQMETDGVVAEFDPFPYDWRLGVNRAAQDFALNLEARCRTPHGPIWIASHSTGGLVVKAALRMMRERGGPFTPETCLAGGGLFFLAVPHGGAAKAIGSMINPDLFFDGLLEKTIADEKPFAHVVNNWLTVWELIPPRSNNHDPFAARDGWFNNPSDGFGDKNVNGDQLNWVLDEKANVAAPYAYDYAQTVGTLPVYNVFGYSVETPGAYDPGSCTEILGHRLYRDFDHNAHLSESVYGDHTVPVWSALWPASGISEQSQYALSGTKHGHVPENGAVQELMRRVISGADHPDVAGLTHGHAAVSLGNAAARLFWRTDICSPVATVAEYAGGTMGMTPGGSVLDGVTDALYEPGAEDDGFKAQTFVIPKRDGGAAPVYRLTAIGDGTVTVWQTDLDGSQHDFVFGAHKGDTATLSRGADEWRLAIDRAGDGTIDETLVANRPYARLASPPTVTEGTPVELRVDAGTANGAAVSYTWRLVSGNGSLAADGPTATYRPDDGPSTARIRVIVTDEGGRSATAEATVDVLNAPPAADAGGPRTVSWGVPIAFHGRLDDASAADRAAGLSPRWSFGDGSSADGADAAHTYARPGVYTATFAVADKDGGTASDAVNVSVTAREARLELSPTSFVFGGTRFTVTVRDALDPATARLSDLAVEMTIDGTSFHAATAVDGTAEIVTPLPPAPGIHATRVTLLGDPLYAAAPVEAALGVANGSGKSTLGAQTSDGAKLTGNVRSDGVRVTGELQWVGTDGTRVQIDSFTAYGQTEHDSWAAGATGAGMPVIVHLVEGEPPRVELWLGGVRQAGSGAVAHGTVSVH